MRRKAKENQTRGIGKILEAAAAQTGRRDALNSLVVLWEGSAGEGRCGCHGAVSSKQGAGERESLSVLLPLETLSLPIHKDIWVERTCESWKNLTEIVLQKDVLRVGCLGVTAVWAPGGQGARAEQAEEGNQLGVTQEVLVLWRDVRDAIRL